VTHSQGSKVRYVHTAIQIKSIDRRFVPPLGTSIAPQLCHRKTTPTLHPDRAFCLSDLSPYYLGSCFPTARGRGLGLVSSILFIHSILCGTAHACNNIRLNASAHRAHQAHRTRTQSVSCVGWRPWHGHTNCCTRGRSLARGKEGGRLLNE
jgi:hypothetical protein